MHSSLTAQSSKTPATVNNVKRPFTRSQPLINLNYFSQLVGSQIRYLVTNLNKKNYKASVAEIHHLIDLYGHDAYLFLLRSLVSNIDFRDIKQKDQQRIQLLNQETINLMKQPNFASCICQTLEGLESMQEDFINNFSKTLKLPLAQEILISVALVNSPDQNTKNEALKFLKTKLNELSPSVTKTIPENVLHSLLYVLRTEGLLKQAQTVMKALQKISPPSQIIAPLLAEGDPTVANSKEVYTKDAGKRQDALMQEIFSTYHISAMMEDIGYSCAETPQSFRDILSQFPDLKEADVAQILGMMSRTHSSLEGMGIPLYKDFPPTVDFSAEQKQQDQPKSWNVNVVIDVLKESFPKLNWPLVVKNLDYPGFYVPDPKGLALIMGVYRKVSKEPFPLDFLFENWKNTSGQLSFLKLAVTAPPDMFNFSQSTKRIDAEGLPSVAKNAPALHQSWYSLSLIETLLRLAEVENYTIVRNIFNYPTKHCPELLCIGLAQAKTAWNALSSELSTLLLPNVLTLNNAASNYTVHKIWALNPSMLVRGMIELYQKDYASLSRILEIATQDLKALTPILETKPFAFTIELAALASRREFLNLDKWLQDKLLEHGNAFAKACVGYMKDKIGRISKGEQSQRLVDTLAIFFTRLQNTSSFSNEVNEEVKAILPKFQAITKITPPTATIESPPPVAATPIEIPPTATSPPPSSSTPGTLPKQQILGTPNPSQSETTRVFPPEIEELSNAYFQKIYTSVLNIDEIVSILTKFKNSKEKREQDVFACMIHNLFDEYRFFPKYPDKELSITGVLFGSLIQHQLVSFLPLGVALRYVLDALRKQPGTKMFKFGLTALDQFKSRLPEWPQYCSHILAIPSIRKVVPEIVDFIEKNLPALPPATAPPSGPATSGMGLPGMQGPMPGMNTPPPPANSQSANAVPNNNNNNNAVKEKLTPTEILQRGVSAPPRIDENVADKIAFVFNNVSLSNMDQKVVELKQLLKDDETLRYTSHYLITKRLSLEYNFHSLYQAVIDKLKSSRLSQLLLSNTLEAIHAFLKSETSTTSSEERQALKNLGNWLGILTLSKNKPLLQKDLGLKELVFDGFETGKLIVVVPFVCKILENCATSKVFKPPNPWVMAIMRLLAELYRLPNLRQSLKFEVEFICKALSVDLNELKPSDSLKERRQYIGPNNFDFKPPPQAPSEIRTISPKDIRPPTSPRTESPTMEEMENIGMTDMNGEMMPGMPDPFVQQLSSYLTISTGIPLFNQQPSLKRCVPIAMDRAIREILSPVVERSVTIACITTREMVMKDFATEPDENKMRKAAHLMVQNLAGSLALVTCKEPLRLSMNNHLKNLLQLQTPEQFHPLVEHAVQVVSADNLDLACTLIEKAATEKAVRDTDDALTAAFLSRKKHRERPGVVPPYFDINFTSGRYPSTLPETLRPKLGGLMSHQLRVYDDFSRIPHLQQQAQQQQQQQFPGQFGDKDMDRRSPTMFDQSQEALTTGQAVDKFNVILSEIDNICSRLLNPNLTLASLPPDNDIVKMLLQIPVIISQSMSRTEVALAFAQRIFKSLYENDAPLYLDIRFNVLDAIVSPNPKITKEITSWLLYLDDERKYHRQITPRLLRAQLLSAPDLDAYLVKMMDTARSKPALDFSIYLLRQISLDPRLAAVADFSGTVDLLTKLARSKGQDELLKLLDDVRSKTAKKEPAPTKLRTQAPTDFSDPPGLREEVVRILEEWVSLYSQPNQSENILASHITTLQQHQSSSLFKDEDSSSRFFRIVTELVIENSQDKLNYTAVDAYSKMVVLLVKYSESPNTKIALLSRVLGVVVRVLMRDYESKKTKFNQRPYFRLFANWFVEMNVPDPTLDQISLQILLAFSNSFMMLSPLRLPGFSFAWLELISHRMFMPKLLLTKAQKGWPLFQRLLVELFKFLEPYLRNAELSDPIRMLYKGTLRVLLVLLHDFPEFLCDFHYSFCDIIPTSCIQMRNLILSAFPRNMRLPDPFTPNLKVDLLPEINQSPRILSNYAVALGHDLLGQLDNYLKNRSPVTFLLELKSRLLLGNNEAAQAGTKYNVSVINAIVLHVGMQAIAQLQNKSSQVPPSMTHSAPMDIFQHLALDLDTEGRYLFLNAIANQLRYPNNHTHYFSCVLLYLFAEASQEIIQEQITRVLLERLIVNRPHPWGLLITFIELIKNPRYSFWNHSFTRCAPEIERLFESVARSCMGPSQPKPQEE